MKWSITLSLILACFLFATAIASAQYQGPKSKDRQYTVKEVRVNAAQLDRIDALVRVRGFIINQLNEESYQFKDMTGLIQVDIDRRILPTRPFSDKTEVILIGEVDYDLLEGTEIIVEQFLFVD